MWPSFIPIEPSFAAMLIALGIAAGIINTLAGGGSNLTLPALMVMGLPADVANATNRVGVLLQSLAAVRGFSKRAVMPLDDAPAIVAPTLIGSLLGTVAAVGAPQELLKPALLLAMVAMSLLILLKPDTIAPPPGTPPTKVADSRSAWWVLFLAGIYGGFVQAGVGFILIAALAGSLRYDLLRSNALKMLCTSALTVVALAIFIWQGLIEWVPGLVLALGTVVGARLGVRIAMRTSQTALKWFLFVMTVVASVAALLN